MVWNSMVRYGSMVGTAWHGKVQYGTVLSGKVHCSSKILFVTVTMVWYKMVCNHCLCLLTVVVEVRLVYVT